MTLLQDVNELLKLNIGDSSRLEHIRESIENNKSLYDSDKKYLEELSKKLDNPHKEELTPKPNTNNETKETEKPNDVEEKLKIAEDKIDRLSKNVKHQEDMEYRRNYYKSEGTTLVLALILGIFGINGVGHIYVGKVGKGIGILIGSIIILAIGITTAVFIFGYAIIFAYILIWIWQILDSKRLCKQFNDYLRQTGKPLW